MFSFVKYTNSFSAHLAVRERFELSIACKDYIAFQERPDQPLLHLTVAESTGVEPVGRNYASKFSKLFPEPIGILSWNFNSL